MKKIISKIKKILSDLRKEVNDFKINYENKKKFEISSKVEQLKNDIFKKKFNHLCFVESLIAQRESEC